MLQVLRIFPQCDLLLKLNFCEEKNVSNLLYLLAVFSFFTHFLASIANQFHDHCS